MSSYDTKPESPAPADPMWDGAVLKGFVQRLGRSSADCEDIVQEAYLRFLETTRRGRNPDSPLGYLHVIARNLVGENLRRSEREQRRGRALKMWNQQLDLAAPSPEELAFVDQIRKRLILVLRVVPQRARQAFLLHRYRALKHSEIARRLQVTERTVERDIAHVVAKLESVLSESE